jgi:hypothetical protein
VLPVVRDCTGQPDGGAGNLQGEGGDTKPGMSISRAVRWTNASHKSHQITSSKHHYSNSFYPLWQKRLTCMASYMLVTSVSRNRAPSLSPSPNIQQVEYTSPAHLHDVIHACDVKILLHMPQRLSDLVTSHLLVPHQL